MIKSIRKFINEDFDWLTKVLSAILLISTAAVTTISKITSFLGLKTTIFFLLSISLFLILKILHNIKHAGSKSEGSVFYKYKKKYRTIAHRLSVSYVVFYLLSVTFLLVYEKLFYDLFPRSNIFIIVNNFEKNETQPFSERVIGYLAEEKSKNKIDSMEVNATSIDINNTSFQYIIKKIFTQTRIQRGLFAYGQYYVESNGNNSLEANILIHNMPLQALHYKDNPENPSIRLFALDTINIRIETKAIMLAEFIMAIYYQRNSEYQLSQSKLDELLKDSANMFSSFKFHCLNISGYNYAGLQDYASSLICFERANNIMPGAYGTDRNISELAEILFLDSTTTKVKIIKGENGKYKLSTGPASLHGFIYDSIIKYRGIFITQRDATYTYYNEETDKDEFIKTENWNNAKALIDSLRRFY
jgi:hypothetical protein